ncbi:MAG: glutamine--fructose-6-phosphate transaminase (isomerizing) [Candidatus Babeliaceae bacterium]
MCSLVGYVGKNYSRSYVLEGLARLEYRGYDSAGFACLNPVNNNLTFIKSAGNIQRLVQQFTEFPIDGFVGIGHTRWATHGAVSDQNAHPHFDCQKTISIVHNGIIENHHALHQQLIKTGHIFSSQTDAESIAHLFESLLLTHKTLKGALVDLVNYLQGAYTFICLMQAQPDTVLVVRKRSPLCIGIGDEEMFIASDPLAFAEHTQKVLFLPDESFALVKKDQIELYNFTGNSLSLTPETIKIAATYDGKQNYEHFMLKEIYEQKRVIYDTVNFLEGLSSRIWEHAGLDTLLIKNLKRVHLIGCGSSWTSAAVAQSFFSKLLHISTTIHIASEFRYEPFIKADDSLYVVISQSGETADTLEALRLINSHNMPTLAVTNVASSTMVREAQGFLLTQAKQEVSVVATKTFTAQVAAFYWLAHRIALEKGIIIQKDMAFAQEELLIAAEVLENSIENYKREIVQKHAPFYAQFKQAIFLGRHMSYAFALEAALKLKEIAYIFVQSYPAGEIKHGALALVEKNIPVFIFSVLDPLLYMKLLSSAHEVKLRAGHLVVFAFEDQHELIALADCAFIFPRVHALLGPVAMTGVMQFLFYQIAKVLNCPIDRPRNLAKSVTVE